MQKKSFSQIISKIIACILSLVMGLILLNNLIRGDGDYILKQSFVASDIVLLLVALLIIAICIYLGLANDKKGHRHLVCFNIYLASAVLLILQIFIFYNIIFVTQTWDVAWVLEAARQIIDGQYELVNLDYFSSFPNNQMILFINTCLVRLAMVFGLHEFAESLFFIVVIQCLLSTFTGLFLYKIAYDILCDKKYAAITWVIYAVLVGLSAWNAVPYTDMMALFFPVAIFRLYQLSKGGGCLYLKWFLIFALTYIGFKIKPTVAIVLIAIIIDVVIRLIQKHDRNVIKRVLVGLLFSIAGLACAFVISTLAIKSLQLNIDPEKNTGALHMLMMGVNPDTDGCFSFEDVAFSKSFDNKADRSVAQIEVVKSRISQMGVYGLAKFYSKKSVMVFNDGTFGMGMEGGFYDIVYSDKIVGLSQFLKNIYYQSGSFFIIVASLCQIIWICIMALLIVAPWNCNKAETNALSLSLVGIVVFNLLFEARARYLFIYVPLFILMAAVCYKSLFIRIQKGIEKCQKKS